LKSDDERKYWHDLLDQILDISELNCPDNKSSKNPEPISYDDYTKKVDQRSVNTYQMILRFKILSSLVMDEIWGLHEDLNNHYEFTRLSDKEYRIYHKLLKLRLNSGKEKYPSREILFNKLFNKIHSIEYTRNFIAFCIENSLPLHIPHATDIVEALRGLNDGQTNRLFNASPTRKWRSNITTIKQLKFLAICQISILMGNNNKLKKYEAIRIVSDYYGCSEDTIKQWAKRDVLETYPKDFLKKIHPVLMKVGERGFMAKNDMRHYLKEFVEGQVSYEEDPMEYLHQFFMNPASNNIAKCKELYKKALKATSSDFPVSISGYNELIRSLHIATSTQESALVALDEMINNYI
jgi:hypothetical protein